MAAEALIALGRPDAVVPWVEQYKRGLEEAPEARNAIPRDGWQDALGDVSRVGDWSVFFQRELAESPWRTVLDMWVGRLAPGIVASATHGVIRTGHAVRSLDAGETPLRLRELGEGLAYWAATYMVLPGKPGPQPANLSPQEALEQLEPLPPSEQVPGATITSYLLKLDNLESFPAVIDLVDAAGDRFLTLVTETFAGAYLANAKTTGHVIGLIHSVTGPSAVRLLAPSLAPETATLALQYAWQAAAGMYAAFGRTPAPEQINDTSDDQQDLIDRAVATGDEHAIKFTEACLREYALNPTPVYLAAAADATRQLGRR
jgi:hypothetical protein